MAEESDVKGLIGWFAKNHVAANLLMMCIAVLGLYGAFNTKREMFPEANFDRIQVQVAYNGASPEEVERGVVVKIEEAIESIKGIRRVDSTAGEGMGSVNAEVESNYEMAEVMDEIKLAVDGISTFPGETERPVISKFTWRNQALAVQVSGDLDESSLKELADRLRDEMLAEPGISFVEVRGARPFEISIEISEDTLRQYGLTLDQISQVIRRWSIDLPGGTIKADSGNIRLRATGQAYTGEEFADILILTQADGTRVRLGDIATIRDGFAETESYSFFNGKRSFGLMVQANDDEDPIQVSAAANRFVEARRATLPPGVELTAWADSTKFLSGRMDMMMKNMIVGALLVFVILGLFLHAKIAFWVIVGTAVAFLGAFTMIESVGVTINLMSLFGFILVLGIVVDDAIIIAESSYAETEKQGYSVKAIVEGAQRVAVPATFGVLTTIMAFAPLVIFLEGRMAPFSAAIGWVVIFCLLFSLVESKLILPSHLAIMRSAGHGKRGVTEFVDRHLKRFITNVYQPLLRGAIMHRWITIITFVGMAILTVGLVGGGFVRIVFAPEFEADYLSANVELREGAPDALIASIIRQMDSALREVNDEIVAEKNLDEPVVKNMYAWINGGSVAGFQVELAEGEERVISPKEIETRWRDRVGDIAGTQTMEFRSMNRMGGGGPPIAFRLMGRNFDLLEGAADELAEHLRTYDGLFEVTSSAQAGPEEIKLAIKPEAEALGITLADLAGQVRQAFYGAESQRIQRGDSEVRVMVRYPRSERRSIGNLENMWIRAPDGREVPFYAVASYDLDPGYSSIKRVDGQRAISVTANADLSRVEPGRLIGQVYAAFIPELLQRYPGVTAGLDGAAIEDQESAWEMFNSFGIAILGIYVLMAIPLKSYLQPLLIMVSIPFGIVGAVIGHLVVGIPLSSVSFIGIVALAGVVVNDSLIMVDFVNKRVATGMPVIDAAIESGMSRFRAITLTSLTTFFGLVPLVLEKSMQAQIVVPMAVSLAFGIVFSTIITLILVPVCYSMLADIKAFVRRLYSGSTTDEPVTITSPQGQGSIGGGGA